MPTKTRLADLTNESPLARRIRGTAHKIAYQYGADADDVTSEITLAILARYADDPAFLDQTDAYIVSHGAWAARDEMKRECAQYVNRTVDGDAPVGEGGEALLELIPDANAWQQLEFGLAVDQALAELDARDEQIARMCAAGWNAAEIGEQVGCARRTVYYRLNHAVRYAFEAQGFAQTAA